MGLSINFMGVKYGGALPNGISIQNTASQSGIPGWAGEITRTHLREKLGCGRLTSLAKIS